MANKKYLVELTVDERVHLSELIKKGKSSAQSNLKARILLKAPEFVGFVGLSGVFLFNFRPWLPGGQSSAPNGN